MKVRADILGSSVGRGIAVLCAAVCVTGAHVASAGAQQRLNPVYPRIVNGVMTQAEPTTGAMLRGDRAALSEHLPINGDTARSWCSGTLIGCRTFLTAGHCVDDLFADETWVYLQHAGLFAVTSVARHPAYAFPVADIAVLKLGAPVNGIEPMALNLTDPLPFIPASGTIVGFGTTGGVNAHVGGGIKYTGRVQTTPCVAGLSPDPDTELLCFDFFDPIGPPGDDSNTCYGDSGGPLFLDLGDGPVVAGVTSGGTGSVCLNEHSYDANVYGYRSFILAELGTDSIATCGGLPSVGDAQVGVLGFDGTLDDLVLSASHSFSVGAGQNSLRVALNGANMYVKAGPGASPTDFDCKADGASVFGACVFDLPTAGTYSIFVQRGVVGSDYQLTATIFGGPPPVCGDGSLDFNEQCDDGNTLAGDCCDANCRYEASGSPCPSDGDPCTADMCDGAGTCGRMAPSAGKVASTSLLLIKSNATDATKDKLTWKWIRGEATTLSELADPAGTTNYTLCLRAGTNSAQIALPAGSRWEGTGTKGYTFEDASGTPDGARKAVLKSGDSGKAKALVRGQGAHLPEDLAGVLPLPVTGAVGERRRGEGVGSAGARAVGAPTRVPSEGTVVPRLVTPGR